MPKRILILNGPNLNLLGKRETAIYGDERFESYLASLKATWGDRVELFYFQSNIEGEIIDKLQDAGEKMDAVVLNAGGYSHTSIAIPDAVRAIQIPVVGVHISNIYNREPERHTDLLSGACKGNISGLGLDGYNLAVDHLVRL